MFLCTYFEFCIVSESFLYTKIRSNECNAIIFWEKKEKIYWIRLGRSTKAVEKIDTSKRKMIYVSVLTIVLDVFYFMFTDHWKAWGHDRKDIFSFFQ